MNTQKYLHLARQGKEDWNRWRKENPKESVDFSGVDFTTSDNLDISFAGYHLGDHADFRGACFGDGMDFEGAIFGDWASFDGATMGHGADFVAAVFGAEARFNDTTFDDGANFERASLGAGAQFCGATFGGDLWFGDDSAVSAGVISGGEVTRCALPVESQAALGPERPAAPLGAISFAQASFLGTARFGGRIFGGEADFSAAHFATPPDFGKTQGWSNLNWSDVTFALPKGWGLGPLSGPSTEGLSLGSVEEKRRLTRLRQCRRIARDLHAGKAQRDLSILERVIGLQARWRDWAQKPVLPRLLGLGEPLLSTVLTFASWLFYDFGRAIMRPIAWIGVFNLFFFGLYAHLVKQPFDAASKALLDFTVGSFLPFGTFSRSVLESSAVVLFTNSASGLIDIPMAVQLASTCQGLMNLFLLFLVALALRNHARGA
ncbi:MAG: hypothetical protein AAF530_19465 [Pseudomonadota bacterium]